MKPLTSPWLYHERSRKLRAYALYLESIGDEEGFSRCNRILVRLHDRIINTYYVWGAL